MDQTILVNSRVEEGRKILAALDETHLQIRVFCWVYYGMEEPRWSLMIASSHPDLNPKNDPYLTLAKTLKELANLPFVSGAIEVVSLNHPFIRAFASLVRPGKTIRDMEYFDTMIGDIFFQDVYFYRLDLSSARSKRSTRKAKPPQTRRKPLPRARRKAIK